MAAKAMIAVENAAIRLFLFRKHDFSSGFLQFAD